MPCVLVKLAFHCFRVGILAAVIIIKEIRLQEGVQGAAIVEGIGVEVVLSIQLVIKHY